MRLVFVTFKTEVNGIWLLLSQCVVVLMLERYGCPILKRSCWIVSLDLEKICLSRLRKLMLERYGCLILKRSCWIVIGWIWKRYGCPVLGRGENIAIKLYNRSYGDLYQLNGFRLTRSAWNAGITISDWFTVSWFLCLWFISAW